MTAELSPYAQALAPATPFRLPRTAPHPRFSGSESAASIELLDLTMVVSWTLQGYYRARYRTETAYVPNGTTLRRRRMAGRIEE